MKVKDEAQWQLQLAEFAADADPTSAVMKDFIVKWCELAEDQITNGWMYRSGFDAELPADSSIEALRKTLRTTEEAQGRIPVGFLGMALVVICGHWAPAGDPDQFFASLTQIEQNLFADVATLKLEHMEAQAAAFSTDPQEPR